MNYLKNAATKTWHSITKHRVLYVLAIILQIVFILTFFGLIVHFQVSILEQTQQIIQPLAGANYNATSIQDGTPFLPNLSAVTDAYNQLRNSFVKLAGWLFITFITLNGAIWLMAYALIRKVSAKTHLHRWIKFCASSALFLGVFALFCTLYLKSLIAATVTPEQFESAARNAGIVFAILYYFMAVSFTQLDAPSWKLFAKKSLTLAIQKAQYIFGAALVTIIILALATYFIQVASAFGVTSHIAAIASLVFMILLVTTKVFWINVIKEIE